ncbi:hypothetical protein ScPMuIL_002636 [Solemya velum]
MLGVPLLDKQKAEDMWESQQRHVTCIQDPPGVTLYTHTGALRKGGQTLPTFRCARGSTSLESFHLHLNRFIPGASASDVHFQAYLLEGLFRWNQDRATQAFKSESPSSLSYSGLVRHAVNRLSEGVFGTKVDESYQPPRQYTGELIGIEYLLDQTGRPLQELQIDVDQDEEKEDIEEVDEDEGFEEDSAIDDVTIPDITDQIPRPKQKQHNILHLSRESESVESEAPDSSIGAIASTKKRLFSLSPPSLKTALSQPRRSLYQSPPTLGQQRAGLDKSSTSLCETPPHATAQSLETSDDTSADVDTKGPDNIAGYDLVHDLAAYLCDLQYQNTVNMQQEDEIIRLWNCLHETDRKPAVFQARYRTSPLKGRFLSSKTSKTTQNPGIERTKRCLVGTSSGPAHTPDCNRYVEALIVLLTEGCPSPIKSGSTTVTRWTQILRAYAKIRDMVIMNTRIMAETNIQLLAINNTTLLNWYKRRQKKQEEALLSQGIEVSDPPVTTSQPIPPAASAPSSLSVIPNAAPFQFHLPPNTAGQSKLRIRSPPPPKPQSLSLGNPGSQPIVLPCPLSQPSHLLYHHGVGPQKFEPGTKVIYVQVPVQQNLTSDFNIPVSQQSTPSSSTPRSTAWYQRKKEGQMKEGQNVRRYKKRKEVTTCSKCKKDRLPETHHQHFGNWYCQETATETFEEWKARMVEKKYTSRKRKHVKLPSDSDSEV